MKNQNVSLGEFLESNLESDTQKKRGAFANVIAFLSLSVVGGLLMFGMASTVVAPAGVAGATAAKAFAEMPTKAKELLGVKSPEPIIVLDRDGKEFARFYSENRSSVKDYDSLGDNVVNALVATEDAKFWEHSGIDINGLARAVIATARGNRQGASTITMQLVENLERTLARQNGIVKPETTILSKLIEMKTALDLEKEAGKKEILLSYLNNVSFGDGYYGIRSASLGYFGVEPSQLTVPQSATLIGLLKGTSLYSPTKSPERSLNRRNTVMWRMLKEGFITEKEYDVYKETPLGVKDGAGKDSAKSEDCGKSEQPYYCSLVKSELLNSDRFGDTQEDRDLNFYLGGFTVQTALDRSEMSQLYGALENWNWNQPWKVASASVKPGTGEITSISQSTEWKDTQINLSASRQQIGSTMKPFVLAEALNQGLSLNEQLDSRGGYKPGNLDSPRGGFTNITYLPRPYLDAYEATGRSNNVYFVRLLSKYGVKPVASLARGLGMKGIPGNLTGVEGALALGVYPVSPIEMAGAYATFASGGIYCEPHTITKVTKGDNEAFKNYEYCSRRLSSEVASKVNDVLSKPLEEWGTMNGNIRHVFPELRGKTGSTNNYDVGTIALYTPNRAFAVAVADPTSPNGNPLRNGVDIYGKKLRGSAPGGETAGAYADRALARYAKENAGSFPQVKSSGDIIVRSNVTPSVVGMQYETALKILLKPKHSIEIVSENCKDKGQVVKQEDGKLTVCQEEESSYSMGRDGAISKKVRNNDKR